MIPKLRNCQNLRRKRGIFVIVCGICRGVDKKQNWPRKPRKCCTKIKPAIELLAFTSNIGLVEVCLRCWECGYYRFHTLRPIYPQGLNLCLCTPSSILHDLSNSGWIERAHIRLVVLKLALEVESYKKTYVSVVQLIMLPTKRLMGTCNWHLGKA